MTEAEWLAATDPQTMLKFVWCELSDRKRRLYLCGGCNQLRHLFFDPWSLEALEVVERYADGQATDDEMGRANWIAESSTFGYDFEHSFWVRYPDDERKKHATLVKLGALSDTALTGGDWVVNEPLREQMLAAAELVYISTLDFQRTERIADRGSNYISRLDWPKRWLADCVFGNPFRPVAFDPRWSSEAAVALATGIYADRAFDRLPVLADALEEAGCDHPNLLAHCRGPGPHARGCWVVDGVLGKS